VTATPSIKVLKTFTYRGVVRTWSNRYHFNGGTPADGAHWTTFSDAIVTAEKAALPTTVTIVGTVGYAAGSDVPVFTKTYTTAGTLGIGSNQINPGDCAVMVRYSTAARTPKNHPVYLYNWYHPALSVPANQDTVAAVQTTALGTYAGDWLSGFSDGTNTYTRAGPNGASATGQLVSSVTRHRDFPR
jgi:hypothetical protein